MTDITVTSRQLRPAEHLGVSSGSPLILDTKRSSDFQNPVFRLSMNGFGVEVTTDGSTTDFREMAAGRGDTSINLADKAETVLNRLSDPQGIRVNNIGVSLAITLSLDGDRYALLAQRPVDSRFMLLSGYVDAGAFADKKPSSRALIEANALKEGGEELIPVGPDGRVLTGEVFGSIGMHVANELVLGKGAELIQGSSGISGVTLGTPYSSLSYNKDRPFQLTHDSMPGYLANTHPAGLLGIDGKPLNAGFQYAQQWNAGQIIIPFELTLSSADSLYLFHAEDKLNPDDKAELITMLNRDGLVLIKLDQNERLTAEAFTLQDGRLTALGDDNPQERLFSEAFASSPVVGVKGIVNQPSLLFKEMSEEIRES